MLERGSERIALGSAGREDSVRHAVNDLFVSGANGGQHAGEVGTGGVSLAMDEIIRTKAHASFHGDQLVAVEVKPLRLNQGWFVITLQHEG